MILIRFDELWLKGRNRHIFEKRLVENLKWCLKRNNIEFQNIKRTRTRMLIETGNECECLRTVFGISSFSSAQETSLENLEKDCLNLAKDNLNNQKTFKINTKRTNKEYFKTSSIEINKNIGNLIQKNTSAKVNLTHPDYELGIEFVDKRVFIFDKTTQCFGGLPTGSSGKILCFIEDKKDILASLLMMKRGCLIVPILKNTKLDINLLQKFGNRIQLKKPKNKTELDELIKEYNVQAYLSGRNELIEEKEKEKQTLQTLQPLIASTQKQIEERFNEFRLCKGI